MYSEIGLFVEIGNIIQFIAIFIILSLKVTRSLFITFITILENLRSHTHRCFKISTYVYNDYHTRQSNYFKQAHFSAKTKIRSDVVYVV